MLESLPGKTDGVLIHDVVNTRNDCVISDKEHVKRGSFLGEIVGYMADEDDCIDVHFSKATDIQQYINLIK